MLFKLLVTHCFIFMLINTWNKSPTWEEHLSTEDSEANAENLFLCQCSRFLWISVSYNRELLVEGQGHLKSWKRPEATQRFEERTGES